MKLALFTLLLGLAVLNRYHLTPALRMRTLRAGANLRRSIRLEALVVLAILATTATLTTVATPERPAGHGATGETESSTVSALTPTSSPHRHG